MKKNLVFGLGSISLILLGVTAGLFYARIGECRTDRAECLMDLRLPEEAVKIGEPFDIFVELSATDRLPVRLYDDAVCNLFLRPDVKGHSITNGIRHCSGTTSAAYTTNMGLTVSPGESKWSWKILSRNRKVVYRIPAVIVMGQNGLLNVVLSDDVYTAFRPNSRINIDLEPKYPFLSEGEGRFQSAMYVAKADEDNAAQGLFEIRAVD